MMRARLRKAVTTEGFSHAPWTAPVSRRFAPEVRQLHLPLDLPADDCAVPDTEEADCVAADLRALSSDLFFVPVD